MNKLRSKAKAEIKGELKEKPEKTITIMADFGFGPYAWLKDASDQTDYVGMNIANRKTGMTEFHITKKLEGDFAKWIDRFERYALDNPDFDWKSFHQEGVPLAKRLKQEVGNLANVLYVKPAEDPNNELEEKTWIEAETRENSTSPTVLACGKSPRRKPMMKFKKLIEKYSLDEVWATLRKLYPEQKKSCDGYKQVFSELRTMKPKGTKMRIIVEEVPAERNQEAYVHVSGKNGTLKKAGHSKHFKDDGKGIQEESFAIEYTPWEEWLGMIIDPVSSENFSEIEIIAHCLWEMTFAGFDQPSIKEKINELKGIAEEIDNMTEDERKEKLIPMEEIGKEFKKLKSKPAEKKGQCSSLPSGRPKK